MLEIDNGKLTYYVPSAQKIIVMDLSNGDGKYIDANPASLALDGNLLLWTESTTPVKMYGYNLATDVTEEIHSAGSPRTH